MASLCSTSSRDFRPRLRTFIITKSKLSNVKIVQLEGGAETEATDVIEDNEPETEAAEDSETTDNGTGLLDLMEVPEPAVVNRE